MALFNDGRSIAEYKHALRKSGHQEGYGQSKSLAAYAQT